MHSLTRNYNRKYYLKIATIHWKKNWKMFKINIAHQLLKLAFWISPDLGNELLRNKSEDWY